MIRVNDKLFKPFLKSYRNLSLKRKLTLLFYIQVIIPIFFIGYLSYSNAARAIKNKSFEYSQDILKMIEMRLKTFCQDTDSLSLQLLYDSRIYEYLNEKNTYVHDSQYNNIRTVFRDAVLSREGIEGIMLLKNNEQFVAFDNKAGFKADEIIPYEYLYKKALEKKGSMCWVTYTYSTNFEDIYGARIVCSRETFKPIGLMVIVIKKKYVESMYSDLSIESYNSIAILSENRDTIVKSKDTEDRIVLLIDKVYNKTKNYFVDNDSKSLISYVDLGDPKWRIIYCIPIKELYRDINELRITIILLVEPIVENALNHGIERVSRQGVLVINSFIKGDDFVIEVNDNGIGMKEDELKSLIKKLNDNNNDVEGSVGLINVNKRIKLFYGDEHGLKIESEYDKFTKITIRISRDCINRGGQISDV